MRYHYSDLSAEDGGIFYTDKYIRYLLDSYGADVADHADDADVLLVTMSSPVDLPKLKRLRADNPDKIIIMGGFEGYMGEYTLAYCDHVVAGNGERFLETMIKSDEIPVDLPEVYSRDSIERRVTIPYEVDDFSIYPLIKTSQRTYYGVAGFGCHNKCLFCATSWSQRHRQADDRYIRRYISAARGASLTLVTNDYQLYRYKKVNCQSFLVRDLLKTPDVLRLIPPLAMARFGVEALTTETRQLLGKPITDDEIAEALDLMGQYNVTVELFYILGFPFEEPSLEPLLGHLRADIRERPRIFLKFTPLEPTPQTPLWALDLRSLWGMTRNEITAWARPNLTTVNRRTRIMMSRTPVRQRYLSVLHRAHADQVDQLPPMPPATMTEADFYDDLERRGLGGLIDCQTDRPLANSHIKTPYSDRLRRAMRRLGIKQGFRFQWELLEGSATDGNDQEETADRLQATD